MHGAVNSAEHDLTHDIEIAGLLSNMRLQLSEASAIASAAAACAEEGWPDRALTVALDIEVLIHDANNLLQTAAILNRQCKKLAAKKPNK